MDYNQLGKPLSFIMLYTDSTHEFLSHKRTLWDKSDWEKPYDDGGKFFGW